MKIQIALLAAFAAVVAACNGGSTTKTPATPVAAATSAAMTSGTSHAATMTSGTAKTASMSAAPGCENLPEVRYYGYAWNGQMGVMYATGGKQAAKDSLMCKHGVNVKLIRQDDNSQLQALLTAFAERVSKGDANPKEGATFVTIMGDGSAAFLKPLNDTLKRLGPDYTAQIVGAVGFSRGEDKFMGPAAWKADPSKAKGGLVAGVLRDGDWNIALKWLGDHKIKNNPDETTYDPDALNWVNATDYIDATQKYVAGYCADLKNVKTKKSEKHCVDGVVTWTPGDVTLAEKKGGLVSIVSTKENKSQMPTVVIGNKKWMSANKKIVEGFLAAAFEGADAVNASDANLMKGAEVSAQVYGEQDAAYWAKYFHPVTTKDKTGAEVELGGSAVINLGDNVALFGLKPGTNNDFAQTYTAFATIVKSQYPKLLPAFDPAAQVVDTTYLKEMMAEAAPAPKATEAPKKPAKK